MSKKNKKKAAANTPIVSEEGTILLDEKTQGIVDVAITVTNKSYGTTHPTTPETLNYDLITSTDETFIPLGERGAFFWSLQVIMLATAALTAYGMSYFSDEDKELNNSKEIVGLGILLSNILRLTLLHLGQIKKNYHAPVNVVDHLIQHHVFSAVVIQALVIENVFGDYFTYDSWKFAYQTGSLWWGWNIGANVHTLFNRVREYNAIEKKLTIPLVALASETSNVVAFNAHLPNINPPQLATYQQRFFALLNRIDLGILATCEIIGLPLFLLGKLAISPNAFYGALATFLEDLGLIVMSYPIGRGLEKITSPEEPYRSVINSVNRMIFFLGMDSSMNGGLGISRLVFLGILLGYHGSATATSIRVRRERLLHAVEVLLPTKAHLQHQEIELTTNKLHAIFSVMQENVANWLNNPTKNVFFNPDHRPLHENVLIGINIFAGVLTLSAAAIPAFKNNLASAITNIVAGTSAIATYHLLKRYALSPYEDLDQSKINNNWKYKVRYHFNYIFRENPITTFAVPYDFWVLVWDRMRGSSVLGAEKFGETVVNGGLVISSTIQTVASYSNSYVKPHPTTNDLLIFHELLNFKPDATATLDINIHTQRCFVELLKKHFQNSSITAAIQTHITFYKNHIRSVSGGVPPNPNPLNAAGMGSTPGTDSTRGLGISRTSGPRFIGY